MEKVAEKKLRIGPITDRLLRVLEKSRASIDPRIDDPGSLEVREELEAESAISAANVENPDRFRGIGGIRGMGPQSVNDAGKAAKTSSVKLTFTASGACSASAFNES